MIRLLKSRRVLMVAGLLAALLAIALWPRTTLADVATIARGPLRTTLDDEGMTRVRDRFVISSPVAGRVLRIELEPGDRVKRGDIVARVRAETPPLLDPRLRAEAQAGVEGARATLGRARADEARARAAVELARRELERARDLARDGLVTAREVETRETDLRTAEETARAATYAIRAAEAAEQQAAARLAPSAPDRSGRVFTVTSPASGVVLKRLRESESVVPAGEALLEVGDPGNLEIVADFISTDAVRIKPGARALVEGWGGEHGLDATVRRVEPAGFTKISALGVEEQRVNVLFDFTEPATALAALGDGYRVDVRVVMWEGQSVLKVPTGALFREGDAWAVYKVEDGRARRTIVTIGHQTGQEAEVLSGLAEGDHVVVHPGDTLVDGGKVKAR